MLLRSDRIAVKSTTMNEFTMCSENLNSLTIEPNHVSAQNIEYLTLSEHYPRISAFSGFIGWAFILVALLFVDFLIEKIDIHIVVFPILLLVAISSGFYGFYAAKICGYSKNECALHFKQGLWWRKQTALSFSRIQHIDISHGPLERKFGMATIKFFTAGGASSDLKIPGLPSKVADEMRSEILTYTQNEEVIDSSKDLTTEQLNG